MLVSICIVSCLVFVLHSIHFFLPAILDSIDFISTNGKCVFRTCKAERDQIVFQMVMFDTENTAFLYGVCYSWLSNLSCIWCVVHCTVIFVFILGYFRCKKSTGGFKISVSGNDIVIIHVWTHVE